MSNKSSEIASFEARDARAACKCDRIGCNFGSLINPTLERLITHTPVINGTRTKVACSSTCHAVPPHSANGTSRAPFPDTRLLDRRIAQTRLHCHLKRPASSMQRHKGDTRSVPFSDTLRLEGAIALASVFGMYCTVHTPRRTMSSVPVNDRQSDLEKG